MDGGYVHDAHFGRGGGFCPVIPLGATVRWARTIEHRKEWTVTGHPQPGYVELDGHGAVSETGLEVVEASRDDEIDGLTAVVAQQCELIASMTADASEFRRLQAVGDDFQRLRDAVSDALLALTGTRRPSVRDCPLEELAALAEELERTELPNGD